MWAVGVLELSVFTHCLSSTFSPASFAFIAMNEIYIFLWNQCSGVVVLYIFFFFHKDARLYSFIDRQKWVWRKYKRHDMNLQQRQINKIYVYIYFCYKATHVSYSPLMINWHQIHIIWEVPSETYINFILLRLHHSITSHLHTLCLSLSLLNSLIIFFFSLIHSSPHLSSYFPTFGSFFFLHFSFFYFIFHLVREFFKST